MIELSPAILTNDISDFRKKYAELLPLSQYFQKLHLDFIDDRFIPGRRTIMPVDVRFIKSSKFTLVAHLMTLEPKFFLDDLKEGHFEWVLFHYEACKDDEEVQDTINSAEAMGLRPGLVINPETPLLKIAKFIDRVKMIQIMGVHPGRQGQTFEPEAINKVKELRALMQNAIISVDGGIKVGIASKVAKAGADILVTGSAILASEDKEMAVEALRLDLGLT